MSFFDEGEEPRTAVRPRRVTAGPGPPDQQTLLVRRAVAVGVGVLLLILIVVGIKGCLNSRKKRSLREYNRNVAALIQQSDGDVGKPFFTQLNGGGGDAAGLENAVNQDRISAERLVKEARKLDVPGDVKTAQRYLIDVLELRRDALRKIAAKLPLALARGNADQAGTAVAQITGQMEAFLSSDVLYSQRVIPYVKKALDDAGITGQTIATSRFLPNLSWLDESQVAARIGSTSRRRAGPATAGTHGHGLTSVSVGSVTLDPTGPNRVPAGSNLAFTAKFQNQGQNDETNVAVRLTISGAGRPITVTRTVPQTTAGQEATVQLPLSQAPPIGRPVRLTVTVLPVPGEKKTDNNTQSFSVAFTP